MKRLLLILLLFAGCGDEIDPNRTILYIVDCSNSCSGEYFNELGEAIKFTASKLKTVYTVENFRPGSPAFLKVYGAILSSRVEIKIKEGNLGILGQTKRIEVWRRDDILSISVTVP